MSENGNSNGSSNGNPRKTFAEMDARSRLLLQRLETCPVGETVFYKEMSALTGVDVQRKGRGYLSTARRRLLADHGILFDAIPAIGVKRLNDSEKIQSGQVQITRSRNASRRAIRRLIVADDAALSPDEKKNKFMILSIAQLCLHVTSPRTLSQLDNRIANSGLVSRDKLLDELRKQKPDSE